MNGSAGATRNSAPPDLHFYNSMPRPSTRIASIVASLSVQRRYLAAGEFGSESSFASNGPKAAKNFNSDPDTLPILVLMRSDR